MKSFLFGKYVEVYFADYYNTPHYETHFDPKQQITLKT